MNRTPIARRAFDKYESYGAYHWRECDRRSKAFNPPLVARYQVVVDRLGSAARVLEMGAGDGCLTAMLAQSGAEVTGVEVDRAAVQLASIALKSTGNCAIIQADCYCLPFFEETFDVVVMADVIEHLDEPMVALAEANRVLKSDGLLLATTPKWRPDRVWDVRHVHEYTPAELQSCLGKYFGSVTVSFFWPAFWSKIYSTRVGWRALRVYARYFPNPFLKSGLREELFGQILAVCREPIRN